MARLSYALGVAPTNTSERSLAELTQLLSRLESSILRADPEREKRLRSDEFERTKLNQNLDYARQLLTRLEQEALGVKLHSKKLETQSDLNRKRDLLERLMDRMHDLEQLHYEDDDGSEGDDILSEIMPTPSESVDSRPAGAAAEDIEEPEADKELPSRPSPEIASSANEPLPAASTSSEDATPPSTLPAPEPVSTISTQTVRPRGSHPAPGHDTGTSTARAALFANRRMNSISKAPATTKTSTATTEAILDHQRAEQDVLSDSILKMASALKMSSQRFSSTLEEDKAVLSRAGDGMDRTEKSMGAASRRMGTLRRMTEGKGWWGRMMLYAWIYGLMVALILLVFVLPKLRF
ncbi:synaptobrevin [Sodiomyces alkalinus F11]|uniref:Synaptobrevin n=1 Tax=Sodiomyces alkalinus (strain CBS 110278 / VKM F-3762 / F11) TaxID=1314773 RepID=A0A3N2Q7X0_SODAK|nr:synaptobrevin [Sodiomyces alkalinus F11]ROT42842.1 synaptobrevin [Sodiomyces alkalinus F11]